MKRQKGAAFGCYTWFGIYGKFRPDAITERLGLEPFRIKKMNEHCAFSVAFNESDWEFGKCEAYNRDIDELLRETIKPFLDKIDILNQIRKENDVRFCLHAHTDIYGDWPMPWVGPSLEVMDFCAKTRTKMSMGVSVDGKIIKLPSVFSP